MHTSSHIEIVPKISKYCNLRCTYCYEFPELANRARMSLEEIGAMFANLRRYTDAHPHVKTMRFAWQGGEAMLIKPDVWDAIAALARDAFTGSPVTVGHVIQTNLTVMSEAWLAFLKERRLFEDIGISFDVVGDRRVDTKGEVRTDVILQNMQTLLDADVPFAAIAVVSRYTVDRLTEVHRFFDDLGVQVRYLPFNQSVSAEQFDSHALTADEVVASLCHLFDLWLQSTNATRIEPLAEYLDYALTYVSGTKLSPPDVWMRETVFVVNTNGDTFGTSALYVPGRNYGNIFRDEFASMFESDNWNAARQVAQERISRTCGKCPYHGACPGFAAAYSFPDELASIAEHGCFVRQTLDHIVRRLEETGLAEEVRGRTHAVSANGALAVAL